MTLDDFRATLGAPAPPAGLAPAMLALWFDGRGSWDQAHRAAQDIDGAAGAWVHAYLHRKEGDLGNAEYWYQRAGRPPFDGAFDEEWALIASWLLDRD
jgi:hypothetical protein